MMKRFMTAVGATAALMAGGCSMIVKETRHSGGYPGHLLDQRTFDASYSKRLQLFRATLILAMAADMGRTTVSGQDADGFAQLLSAAASEINYAAADLFANEAGGSVCSTVNALPPGDLKNDIGCAGFYENFESNLPLIEARIIKVMLAALPTAKVRKFLEDAKGGNVMGAAWSALGAMSEAVSGLHVSFARYRTGIEIVAASLAQCKGGGTFDAKEQTVVDAAACLGLSPHDLFSPGALHGRNLAKGTVQPRAFLVVMRGIAADCVALNFSGKGTDLVASQNIRKRACNTIGFAPKPRPYRFRPETDILVEDAPLEHGSTPLADAN
ncbi:hypothetical protein ABIC65_001844 [Sphingomonas trueperi]|uniref:hypothetical protein n=1 Tax=Sphingomonas trueperi TaxID=53317 RepID=UPI00339A18B7